MDRTVAALRRVPTVAVLLKERVVDCWCESASDMVLAHTCVGHSPSRGE